MKIQGTTTENGISPDRVSPKEIKKGSSSKDPSRSGDIEERVNVTTSQGIRTLLDPDAFAAERAALVNDIKRQVNDGSYFKNRSSNETAQKIGQSLLSELQLVKDLLVDSTVDDNE
jgi:hypothetical protein